MNGDDWSVNRNSQLLLWVPPYLRTGLQGPNTLVIHNRGSLKLKFESVVIGSRWREYYAGRLIRALYAGISSPVCLMILVS
jgi:hypothetical protein